MSKPTELPFLVCGKKIVHDCEKCGRRIVLPDAEARRYSCPDCGTAFRTEVMPDGTPGIILTPVDNTRTPPGRAV